MYVDNKDNNLYCIYSIFFHIIKYALGKFPAYCNLAISLTKLNLSSLLFQICLNCSHLLTIQLAGITKLVKCLSSAARNKFLMRHLAGKKYNIQKKSKTSKRHKQNNCTHKLLILLAGIFALLIRRVVCQSLFLLSSIFGNSNVNINNTVTQEGG